MTQHDSGRDLPVAAFLETDEAVNLALLFDPERSPVPRRGRFLRVVGGNAPARPGTRVEHGEGAWRRMTHLLKGLSHVRI